MPICSAQTTGESRSSGGSVTRPTTRSTISQSGARLRARRDAIAARLHRLDARRQSEVKRDMEMARDEVRVMTVHGAKGLEAPDRHPRRHYDAAAGLLSAEALVAADRQGGAGHAGAADLGQRESQ
jgi:hypothetical protein